MLFTIGYATKSIDTYIAQLRAHDINVVADVRSVPYSKAFFDYHQEAFQGHLKRAGIRYVYLGAELGPRSKNPLHYNASNQVQFELVMKSDLFLEGVTRLENGINKGFRIALSCAEKDPAVCHRSLLIAFAVDRLWKSDTQHILHDGHIELQSDLERRLMHMTNSSPDMLTTEEEALRHAYQRQCQCCAYVIPKEHYIQTGDKLISPSR